MFVCESELKVFLYVRSNFLFCVRIRTKMIDTLSLTAQKRRLIYIYLRSFEQVFFLIKPDKWHE